MTKRKQLQQTQLPHSRNYRNLFPGDSVSYLHMILEDGGYHPLSHIVQDDDILIPIGIQIDSLEQEPPYNHAAC